MLRNWFLLLVLALPAVAFADEDAAAEAAAQAASEKNKPAPVNLDLDERIRPVSGRMFTKHSRHEITPTFSLSLNDAFFSKYVAGLRYAYHFNEEWSVALRGEYAFSESAGAVAKCDANGRDCGTPSKQDLARTPGDIGMLVGADVSWAPLYGKISVLASSVLHFDTYLLAGAGALESKIAGADRVVETKWTPEVHLGVGQRYFVTRSVVLRFELRDVLYQQEVMGRSGLENDIQNQLLFTVGLSFFLGDSPES